MSDEVKHAKTASEKYDAHRFAIDHTVKDLIRDRRKRGDYTYTETQARRDAEKVSSKVRRDQGES